MAGAAVPEIGVVVACPSCGNEVMQKTMIPIKEPGSAEPNADGHAPPVVFGQPAPHVYVCVACAKLLINTAQTSDESTEPEGAEPERDEPEGDEPEGAEPEGADVAPAEAEIASN